MALVRPQLLFFGKSPKQIASYDRAGKKSASFWHKIAYCMNMTTSRLRRFNKIQLWISADSVKGLTREHALEWIGQILAAFDQILILEHFELSLAVLSLQLNIPADDLLYVAVNQQTAKVDNKSLNDHRFGPEKFLNFRYFSHAKTLKKSATTT